MVSVLILGMSLNYGLYHALIKFFVLFHGTRNQCFELKFLKTIQYICILIRRKADKLSALSCLRTH